MKKTMVVFLLLFLISLACAAAAETGAAAPQTAVLDSISDKYGPVFFTHERHARMAGDCGICHHEHGGNGALPCGQCHRLGAEAFKSSVGKSFLACRNCHGGYGSDPAMPSLKVAYHRQCFQCHTAIGGIGVTPKGCAMVCHAARQWKD
ncbi:MAG: cytochrome c3 family protein [Nitrospiraceae bacterium]|nr:cytochrome c3 family protein [Nitrospiraceae bacterium]